MPKKKVPECCICMDRKVDCIFEDCCHQVTCHRCTRKLRAWKWFGDKSKNPGVGERVCYDCPVCRRRGPIEKLEW